MLNARCSICLDLLDAGNSPMATRCGHLYCLDCATFNFGRQNVVCVRCKRPHSLQDLVRLFPDYEEAGGSQSRGRLALGDVTHDTFPGVDMGLDSAHESRTVLKSIRKTLAAVYSIMEEKARSTPTQDIKRCKQEFRSLKTRIKEQRREGEDERRAVAAQLKKEREELQTMEWELQEKLSLIDEELQRTKVEILECEERLVAKTQEMSLWRLNGNRYKKKYYVLKAQARGAKKQEDSDDSLEIV